MSYLGNDILSRSPTRGNHRIVPKLSQCGAAYHESIYM